MTICDPQLLRYILNNLHALLIRDYLLDIFTETDKTLAHFTSENSENIAVLEKPHWIYNGKFLNINGMLYGVTGITKAHFYKGDQVSVQPIGIRVTGQLCQHNSKITLHRGDIDNYTDDVPLETTLGRLLLNYVILVDPFNDIIPYINDIWNSNRIEENFIFENLRTGKISVESLKHYSRNVHWLGHFTELSVPSLTERSLTVDPKIIVRRDELLKEHAVEIAAGDAVVMNQIETELVAMDKASLKGDVSTLFYDNDSKSYEIHRKMMLITGGMIPKFDGKGYSFIGNSLEEGWEVKNFPVICNEIRRGAFATAIQTAKGGEETKFVIRVFQNTRINCDDCNSTTYLHVNMTNEMAKRYLYRNILVDGKLVTLSDENINGYIGKVVQMRSPLYCQDPTGYCFTCMGKLFQSIDQEVITMVGVAVSSSFTKSALKSKHFTLAKTIEIKSLNQFVI
jgi:hypothetical protein